MLMYQDKFVSKWVSTIHNRMKGMCEESFVVPMIALFYNDAATSDILESKQKMRLALNAIERRAQAIMRLPWYRVFQRLSGFVACWRERVAVRIGVWRRQPPEEAVNQCLCSPEFEFLKYLHKLTERMIAWRAFPDKHLPPVMLPKEFVDIKGHLDAPLSAYDNLSRIQETADALIPAEMQRTMFAVMLSEMMCQPEQRTPAHRE
jgi:hypothetical protein